MRPSIKYALRAQGVSDTDTKEIYYTNIFTHLFNSVKKRLSRISLLCASYIQKRSKSSATPLHSQNIFDPDGEQVNAALKDSVVSIVDKQGGTARFSAYLVPEMRASLLEIEKKFGRRFTR